MIVGKHFNPTHSTAICDAQSNKKLYKNEDIPLTISASLAKQSSLQPPRNRVKKNNHGSMKEFSINTSAEQQHWNDNESNDNEIDYTYNNQNHHVHYSTMNSNARDYLRKTTGHLNRNINNNSTIASTNRYRWHNQSDEIALQNNSVSNAIATKAEAMTMHSNHRSHSSNRRQQHQNHINNNFIVSNKKHSLDVHNTNDDQHSIDQNNGNHYPSRLYH